MPQTFIRTAQQQQFVDKINALVPKFQQREPALDVIGSFPYENIKELVDIGYTKLILPKENGGSNLSTYELVLFQEHIAKGDGATAISIGWHMGTLLGLRTNTAWPQETWQFLCKEIENGALINLIMSERGSGSPTRGATMQTTAVAVEGGYEISGRKAFATLSPVLNYFVSGVSLNGEDAFFLIPKNAPGVSVDGVWDSVALRGSASHDIILDKVFVPQHFLVQQANIAESVKRSPGGLIHIPACYLGIAQAAKEHALKFAKNYVPKGLGKPIIETPHVQAKIGEIELLLTQSRYLLYGVAERYDLAEDKEPLVPHLLASKSTVVNNAIKIIDLAMRVCGAQSLSEQSPLHRYYLHVRAGLHNPPSDDEILAILAQNAK